MWRIVVTRTHHGTPRTIIDADFLASGEPAFAPQPTCCKAVHPAPWRGEKQSRQVVQAGLDWPRRSPRQRIQRYKVCTNPGGWWEPR